MRTKKHFFLSFILLLVMLISGPSAIATKILPINENAKQNTKMNNSPHISIEDINHKLTPPGLERRIFILPAKPGTQCGNGICEAGEKKSCSADCGGGNSDNTSACYSTYPKGVAWKSFPIDYSINTNNSQGLSADFIQNTLKASVSEWDKYTGVNLSGTYTIDTSANWDSDTPDGRNEISFGNYSDSNTIAVAIVWGYFSGPPRTREIIEFDILFNEDFEWGNADIDPTKMDFQSIATHELGHGYGLEDLYTDSCILETMYGYGSEGQTHQRTLHDGDKVGLNKIY